LPAFREVGNWEPVSNSGQNIGLKGKPMASMHPPEPPRRPSRRLTEADAAVIKKMLSEGHLQSRIAAEFDVNGGRIAEINTGQKFAHVAPAS